MAVYRKLQFNPPKLDREDNRMELASLVEQVDRIVRILNNEDLSAPAAVSTTITQVTSTSPSNPSYQAPSTDTDALTELSSTPINTVSPLLVNDTNSTYLGVSSTTISGTYDITTTTGLTFSVLNGTLSVTGNMSISADVNVMPGPAEISLIESNLYANSPLLISGSGSILGSPLTISVSYGTLSTTGSLSISNAVGVLFGSAEISLPEGLIVTSSPITISGTGSVIGSGITLSMTAATSVSDGYLSSIDWAVFNAKQSALGYTPENVANKGMANGYASLGATGLIPSNQLATGTASSTTFLRGDGTWAEGGAGTTVHSSLSNLAYVDSGHTGFVPSTVSIITTSPISGGGDLSTSRTISITVATSSSNGYLSSADWDTFNAKLANTDAAVGSRIAAASEKSTPVDGDWIALADSAASNVLKKLGWDDLKATLKTYFDGIYKWADSAGHCISLVATDYGIGIGIDTPLAKLHVKDETSLLASFILGDSPYTDTANRAGFGFDNYGGGAQFDIITYTGSNIVFRCGQGTEHSYSRTYMRINSANGNVRFGGDVNPTAKIHIAGGSTGANTAPLKLSSGSVNTTPETGAVEYNGTNLLFVRTGTTRETIFTGNAGAGAPTPQTLLSLPLNVYGSGMINQVLGTPDSWASVNINGTIYKIPLYT